MKKIGILGYGQVGKALHLIYKKNKCNVLIKDVEENNNFKQIEFLNICISYSNNFFNTVVDQIIECQSKIILIHSTVPIGTTLKIQEKLNDIGYDCIVAHSPIRGNHDNLKKSIIKFKKYVGCFNKKGRLKIKKHLNSLGIKTIILKNSNETEMLKLLCSCYYGLCIAWHFEMNNISKYFNVDFKNIKIWNKTYNNGYKKIKQYKYIRPILDTNEPFSIGGKCVIPNVDMLNKQILETNNFLNLILKYK